MGVYEPIHKKEYRSNYRDSKGSFSYPPSLSSVRFSDYAYTDAPKLCTFYCTTDWKRVSEKVRSHWSNWRCVMFSIIHQITRTGWCITRIHVAKFRGKQWRLLVDTFSASICDEDRVIIVRSISVHKWKTAGVVLIRRDRSHLRDLS